MQRSTWYESYVAEVLGCSACTARKDCLRPVPGEGNLYSDIIFVGRNPGETEDEMGRPFVGAAGQILDRYLRFIGLGRSDVFITNLCLCHTKGNRFMSKQEIRTCFHKFLLPTIDEIKPGLVVTLGTQVNYFINGIKVLGQHHAKLYKHKKGFYVMPGVHPAACCYSGDFRLMDVLFAKIKEWLDAYKKGV
jgi:DNA polymerase